MFNINQVYYGPFPLNLECADETVLSLAGTLQRLMVGDSLNDGYLFTGQTVTVAFWRCQENLYLFDSHAVNQERRFDFTDENNNLARVFRCDGYFALAGLLLQNSAMDGVSRQFTVTKLSFCTLDDRTLPTTIAGNDLSLPLVIPPTDHLIQCQDLRDVTSQTVEPCIPNLPKQRKSLADPRQNRVVVPRSSLQPYQNKLETLRKDTANKIQK